MVPKVLGAPGAARLDPVPGRAAEDAVLGVHRPAAGVEGCLRFVAADAPDRVQPVGIGQETLAQIGRIGQPVVHLHVDVGMVVAPPGRGVALVPTALQIGRQPARPRGRNQQIAAILEEQGLQSVVRAGGLQVHQALVGGQGRFGGVTAEVEGDAVEEGAIVITMSTENQHDVVRVGVVQPRCDYFVWRHRIIAPVGNAVLDKVGTRVQQ